MDARERRAYRHRGPPFEPPPSQTTIGYLSRGVSRGGGPGRGGRQGGRGKPVASRRSRMAATLPRTAEALAATTRLPSLHLKESVDGLEEGLLLSRRH